MKQYYIPYNENTDINYIYLLALYDIAEYSQEDKAFNVIQYHSANTLSQMMSKAIDSKKTILSISKSTVNRLLNDEKYQPYFQVDKEQKIIILKNNAKEMRKFVVLSQKEVGLIKQVKENLFAKYLMFLKYYFSFTQCKGIDTTAKQFLAMSGYATTSNAYLSKLSEYNGILVANGIVKIKKYKDDNGYERNVYRCN